MKLLSNLKYSDKHAWLKIEGDVCFIGITDYAQDQLGEILFVEMPEVGDEISQGDEFGVVESSKVASDLIAPISGEVLEINEKLEDEPEYVNENAYDAWIVKIRVSDENELDDLLSDEQYRSSVE